MTKKEIVEKLNKEYPKLLKNINNKKISQKDKNIIERANRIYLKILENKI